MSIFFRACLLVLLGGLPAVGAQAAEPSYSILHSFQFAESNPAGPLISDGRGNLYGTTAAGGLSANGTVFTIRRNGTGFQRLHSFAGDASDGINPSASLTLDGRGNLYGTTTRGGPSNGGTVFTLRTDGTGFRLLHSFTGEANDGFGPEAALILDGSGNLYGTTAAGGPPVCCSDLGGLTSFGTVFTLRTDGTGFKLLRGFVGGTSDGANPMASLVLDSSGNLYGTTAGDGYRPGTGTVFTLRTDGTGFQILHAFAGGANDGKGPVAPLTLDSFGNLYGTTVVGGSSDGGTIFMLKSDGTGFRILHSFAGGASDGHYPYTSLLLDESGNLYGTTSVGGQTPVHSDTALDGIYEGSGTVFRVRTDGTGFQLLHSFVGGANDADTPRSALISDGSGNLFGTTYFGGSPNAGTVFSISTDGSRFRILHAFAGFQGDGGYPWASVIPDGSGNLYGTTAYGGSLLEGGGSFGGTVFRIRSDGTGFQLLHAFVGGEKDGVGPAAPLTMDQAGNLFGTTTGGGSSKRGTVFRLRSDGTGFELLHTFVGGAGDGLDPSSGLILDGAGNLYGTTDRGGPDDAGTVFRIKSDGAGFQLLHTFTLSPSGYGQFPVAPLVLDGAGNLYGATSFEGGPSNAFGTVFTVGTDGTGFRVLHTFTDSPDDGRYPFAPLIMDRSGILYGTTSGFGPSFNGTVFRLEPDGTGFQLLHAFGGSDGGGPRAALILDDFGNLYGTTYYGGASAAGTVFTVRTDGTGYRILHAFGEDEGDGKNPASSLFLDSSGTLFGTTANGGAGTFGTVFALSIGRHHPVVTPGPFVPVQRH